MIQKFRFGTPFETDAVISKIKETNGALPYFDLDNKNGIKLSYTMEDDDIVYGL